MAVIEIDENGVLKNFDTQKDKKIEFPNTIIEIGDYASDPNAYLEEVIFPSSLNKLGMFAFYIHENLKKVEFQEGIECIDKGAFRGCKNLNKINLPQTINYIGEETFMYCHSLENIEISNNVRVLKDYIFAYCTGLKKVVLPNRLETIEKRSFFSCEEIENIIFPKSLRYIKEGAFQYCTKIKKLEFPSSLISVSKEAFKECKSLEEVVFNEGIIKLEKSCFDSCLSLEKIYLPETLTIIEENVFERCNDIKNIVINNYNNLFAEGIVTLRRFDYYFDKENESIVLVKKKKLDSDRYQYIDYEKYMELLDVNRPNAIIISLLFSLEELKKKEIKNIDYLLDFISKENINKKNYKRIKNALYNNKEFLNLIKHIEGEVSEKPTFLSIIKQSYNEGLSKIKKYDLFKLVYTLGGFDDDIKNRQKATEFIKNVFDKEVFDSKKIHGMFGALKFSDFNKEWQEFFTNKKNFIELINLENEESGCIAKICNNFEKIKEFARSNKGNQHYRKVTFEICKEYFKKIKFDRVDMSTVDISEEIGKYTRSQNSFDEAVEIRNEFLKLKKEGVLHEHLLEESLTEKNIFEQIEIEKENILESAKNTLEFLNELSNKRFTYEFLSKQDPLNFTLGKYCSCCAHLEGMGYSIMKASILHPDCQNIIIRNEEGKIIAKSTLYINRSQGYGVLNNIEINDKITSKEEKRIIYMKYKKAIEDFVEIYNRKNKNNPIIQVNVGMKLNDLESEIVKNGEKSKVILKAIDFSKYGKNMQSYSGDWQNDQYIIYDDKRKRS